MVDTLVNFGFGALLLTFLVSLYGIGAALYGNYKKENRWIESARSATMLTFPLLTVAISMIVILLIQNHFEVAYVAQVTSLSMPTYLKVTALWGGQPGSLVFWSWLMSIFSTAIALRNWHRDREMLPWVIVIVLVTLSFFLSLAIFFENPFARLWAVGGQVQTTFLRPAGGTLYTPGDGNGLNPLLRHPGMIIHPPMQYLGFVAFVIPYAFAMAALITGRTDSRWIHITRKWTLWAWLFLSMGLVLGMRWAYDVLGWGGYWGWDPVENAALMPWLTATPFLHSVMIQEKRGMLKRWNMFLVILTYDLIDLRHLSGTFRGAFFRTLVCPKRHRSVVLYLYCAYLCGLDLSALPPLARTAHGDRNDLLVLAGRLLPDQQPAVHRYPGSGVLGRHVPDHYGSAGLCGQYFPRSEPYLYRAKGDGGPQLL